MQSKPGTGDCRVKGSSKQRRPPKETTNSHRLTEKNPSSAAQTMSRMVQEGLNKMRLVIPSPLLCIYGCTMMLERMLSTMIASPLRSQQYIKKWLPTLLYSFGTDSIHLTPQTRPSLSCCRPQLPCICTPFPLWSRPTPVRCGRTDRRV